MLKKLGMEKANPKRALAPTYAKPSRNSEGENVDERLYRSMIGSLLYLTASRPDISYIVGVYAHFQSNPKVSHMTSMKRILKYICGTSDYGLLYSLNTRGILVGFCDADYAGISEDKKSTSSSCFFLGTI